MASLHTEIHQTVQTVKKMRLDEKRRTTKDLVADLSLSMHEMRRKVSDLEARSEDEFKRTLGLMSQQMALLATVKDSANSSVGLASTENKLGQDSMIKDVNTALITESTDRVGNLEN